MTLPKAVIVDLDGTLCDHSHRLHFVDPSKRTDTCVLRNGDKMDYYWLGNPGTDINKWGKFKPDYDSFYAAMSEDGINEWCKSIILSFHESSHTEGCVSDIVDIILLTGRPEKYRSETKEWLSKLGLEYSLFMRPDFLNGIVTCSMPPREIPDHRPTHEVKSEIYEREIKGKYDVLFAIDDDPKCVQMYRSLGLTCLDVGRK